MKKYFITGLMILLPVALTLAVVLFFFNLFTAPFSGFVRSIFERYGLLETGFLFFSADQVQTVISQLLVLVFLFIMTVGLGYVARWFFFHYFLKLWDLLLHRIPIVKSIYKVCQDLISTIFAQDTNAFKQVVLIRFPNPETYTIGLVTRETPPFSETKTNGSSLITVFVPTTPNPTSGFLTLLPKEDIIYLDMKVEDAFKFILSCGVISPEFAKNKRDL